MANQIRPGRDLRFATVSTHLEGNSAIQDTIAKGVSDGEIAYVGKGSAGKYLPFIYGTGMLSANVEISDDVFIIRKETADAYKIPDTPILEKVDTTDTEKDKPLEDTKEESEDKREILVQTELFSHIEWTGEIPPQKWMNFYTKVVSKFAAAKGVKLTVTFEAAPEGGVSKQKVEEAKAALRELGLHSDIKS
jgi:hypothetical protein